MKKGKKQPVKGASDTEIIPLSEDIDAYMKKNAMPIKQMKEERGLDNHGNRIAYTGANMIMLVQITRSLKESHKHIPDAVLLVALGFVFSDH